MLHYKCYYLDCERLAEYNYSNEIFPLYCHNHKLNDMIKICDYTYKFCIHGECTKKAIYGYNINNALFCNDHKKVGMINVIKYQLKNQKNNFEENNDILYDFDFKNVDELVLFNKF